MTVKEMLEEQRQKTETDRRVEQKQAERRSRYEAELIRDAVSHVLHELDGYIATVNGNTIKVKVGRREVYVVIRFITQDDVKYYDDMAAVSVQMLSIGIGFLTNQQQGTTCSKEGFTETFVRFLQRNRLA